MTKPSFGIDTIMTISDCFILKLFFLKTACEYTFGTLYLGSSRGIDYISRSCSQRPKAGFLPTRPNYSDILTSSMPIKSFPRHGQRVTCTYFFLSWVTLNMMRILMSRSMKRKIFCFHVFVCLLLYFHIKHLMPCPDSQ